MRVAVVTQYFPTSQQPWAGHSAYQTLRVLAGLCQLHVFYPEVKYPGRLAPESSRRPPLDRGWSPPGVDVTYIPYPALPVISRPLNGFVMAHHLLPSVRQFAPDLILNYAVYPDGFAAVRIGKVLKVPVVLTAIGSDLNRISDPLCGALTRSALRDADFVTTVSHDLARTAHRLGADPARTRAILNGCDTGVFYPQDRAIARQSLHLDLTAQLIVYVGRLDLRKGLLELVEAVSRLVPERPRVRCYLVGDGPDRPALTDAIARYKVTDHVFLAGPCPTDQVALWMAASDLVTLPSYREGCPNVVIEALAAGRPVVATNVGGIPELMDDTSGRLIRPADVSALTTALGAVLDQHWDPSAISSQHSRSWSDVADDLYQALVPVRSKGSAVSS